MTRDSHELVRVAAGKLVSIESYQQALKAAGIESRVVGEELGSGLGTAIPDSIELWVHRSDVERAKSEIEQIEGERGRAPHAERPAFGHPKSDHKPNRPGGHGPHTHYNPDPRS